MFEDNALRQGNTTSYYVDTVNNNLSNTKNPNTSKKGPKKTLIFIKKAAKMDEKNT